MLLRVDDVAVAYGEKQVVHGVSLEVGAGEVVGLIGHNGAGKSTLLKAIFGVLPPRGGRIVLDGQDVSHRSVLEHLDLGIGFSPQGAQVFPTLTVAHNLELGGYTIRSQEEVRRQQRRVYELFPILQERSNAKAGVLSGGERRMLAMGMAMMRSPRLYLLDEPSGGLAPLYVEKLFETVRQINRELGTAILLVEENLRQVLEIASRVYVMSGGRITLHRRADELGDEQELRAALAGGVQGRESTVES